MVSADADRNLLYGILAVQMDFISRDDLIDAMHAWVLTKQKTLGELLVERGALDGGDHTLLESMVRRHLRKHGEDAERSLAAVPGARAICEGLALVADAGVQATLGQVAIGQDGTEADAG